MVLFSVKRLNLAYHIAKFKELQVLSDVDFSIREKETIGILGPSGSGKTQLVYSIGRLNEYFGARINCDSMSYYRDGQAWNLKETEKIKAFRKTELGYIFQEPFLYFNPTLTLGNQLIRSESSPQVNRSVLYDWLDRVGLKDADRMLSSYPHQVSGGQLQRLAIVAALLKKPRIVVADEITSSLDLQASRLIMDLLATLKKDLGFALVWVTHEENEAIRYCDRILVLGLGSVQSDVPADEYKANSFNVYLDLVSPVKSEELLRMTEITKSFKRGKKLFSKLQLENQVLKGITLTIRKNEILGLIGSSGSGKSTLGKIISGLESWDHGSMEFNGLEKKKGFTPTRDILYLFQDAFSALNPQLSCQRLIGEALEAGNHRMDLDIILSLARLDRDILPKKAGALSGGLRQRFALARALAAQPGMLVMDESVNALDINLQMEIIEMLLHFRRNYALTILFISHQLEVISQFADRIFVLENGKLTEKDIKS